MGNSETLERRKFYSKEPSQLSQKRSWTLTFLKKSKNSLTTDRMSYQLSSWTRLLYEIVLYELYDIKSTLVPNYLQQLPTTSYCGSCHSIDREIKRIYLYSLSWSSPNWSRLFKISDLQLSFTWNWWYGLCCNSFKSFHYRPCLSTISPYYSKFLRLGAVTRVTVKPFFLQLMNNGEIWAVLQF